MPSDGSRTADTHPLPCISKRDADAGVIVLGPEELRAAWNLAREMVADMPEQEYL